MAQIVVVSLPYFAVVTALFYFFVQRMHWPTTGFELPATSRSRPQSACSSDLDRVDRPPPRFSGIVGGL